LGEVRRGELGVDAALARSARIEVDPRWLVAPLLGCAAASLARLLGADHGAIIVDALAVATGYVARQELGRRRVSNLALPLVAAFIGAILGGLAIRRGWTATPALALIVPSLILVPGPHIINGILDLIDSYVTLGISRSALSASILISAAIGITVGIEMTLGEIPDARVAAGSPLNVLSDMLLAGFVTCEFAIACNTQWSHIDIAIVGGMLGHGLRFLALQQSFTLGAATFVGGVGVGIVSAMIARGTKPPFAVIAFAGAVTMMPCIQFYRSVGGFFRLALLSDLGSHPSLELALGNTSQACVVSGALALGLIVGLRAVSLVAARETANN
jgi:uncharacterized membrane protein YjjB (DUF3815 family)